MAAEGGGGAVEALAAVRAAVAELQEANFEGIEGFQRAKQQISATLLVAQERGACEKELIDAAQPKSIDLDDAAAAGSAARKARKLRLLGKEYVNRGKLEQERLEKERLERERAHRVSERLALRRGGPAAERLEQERQSREKEETERAEADRAARVALNAAARRARARAAEAEAGANEAAAETGEAAVPDSSPAAASAQQPKYGGFSAKADAGAEPASEQPARARSRSPRHVGAPAGDAAAAAPSLELALAVPAVPSLSSLLGRPPDSEAFACGSPASGDEPAMGGGAARRAGAGGGGRGAANAGSDVPLSVLMGGAGMGHSAATGVRRIGADDLSTGGDQVCYNFSIGRCSRWNCRFKHPARPT
mmetsp:Transcript_28484/g.94541  ORF Transcript_28484/g.94541 Transcript_28484/m.94541 type:complete len:365 (-) Transcript_28484:112-1206(-)